MSKMNTALVQKYGFNLDDSYQEDYIKYELSSNDVFRAKIVHGKTFFLNFSSAFIDKIAKEVAKVSKKLKIQNDDIEWYLKEECGTNGKNNHLKVFDIDHNNQEEGIANATAFIDKVLEIVADVNKIANNIFTKAYKDWEKDQSAEIKHVLAEFKKLNKGQKIEFLKQVQALGL